MKAKNRHRGRLTLVCLGAVIILAIGADIGWRMYKTKVTNPYYPKAQVLMNSPQATSSPAVSSSPEASVGSSAVAVTSAPQAASTSGGIVIMSPTQGSTVASGATVTGQAKVSQSKLYFLLKGGKSGQLASGVIQVTPNVSSFESYTFKLAFTNQVQSGTDQGVLEVYTVSPGDGSETDVASVNVNIQGS
jgi:hypothetical protein